MLKSRLPLFLGVVCLILAAWYLTDNIVNQDRSYESTPAYVNANATEGAQPQEIPQETPLDQSLKAISLSQGEGGFEIWRLKAAWANVMLQGDKIIVEKPQLIYFDKENERKNLHVHSDTGDIEQKSQILRFMDNVRIMQEDRLLEGNLLVYNGTAKTMTFPQGARFAGPGMTGSADHIVWDISRKIILGTNGIHVFFESRKNDANGEAGK